VILVAEERTQVGYPAGNLVRRKVDYHAKLLAARRELEDAQAALKSASHRALRAQQALNKLEDQGEPTC
jgi:hypothetical protein